MEECEALCTQIAIMVNWEVKCLGSTQHLKTKFGKGYTLLARVHTANSEHAWSMNESKVNSLVDFLHHAFPGAELKDVHVQQGFVHCHIPATPDLTWAAIFGTIEKNKGNYSLEDYSVSQSTLEQIFINLARAQIPPVHHKVGCCKRCCRFLCCCGGCGCCASQDNEELVAIVNHEDPPALYTWGLY